MLSTAFLLAASMVVGQAEKPNEDWLKFFKGQWTYEYSSLSVDGEVLKGEVTYSAASKSKAILARGTEGNDKWVELIGWQPDRKRMVSLGYGSLKNNYWLAEYDELSKDRLGGKVSGVLADGRPFSGTSALERVDDNCFEVHLKIKSGEDEISDVGKFKRKVNREGE